MKVLLSDICRLHHTSNIIFYINLTLIMDYMVIV